VENDRPPAFPGAADGGHAPRFLSVFVGLSFSRFDREPLATLSNPKSMINLANDYLTYNTE
jgi:hypothetical protein